MIRWDLSNYQIEANELVIKKKDDFLLKKSNKLFYSQN